MKYDYEIGSVDPFTDVFEQKFVVCRETEGDLTKLVLHTRNLDYERFAIHKHIVRAVQGDCVGGGKVDFDEKGFYLSGHSTDYGPVHTKIRDQLGDLLAEKFGANYKGHGIDYEPTLDEINQEWENKHGLKIE